MTAIPAVQRAVQLTGPDQLTLNNAKDVHNPGPGQVLCRVEAVGLCFSDLKLLKQFSAHARKSSVLKGIDANALAAIASYVPGEQPTVPGHEAVVVVVKAGPGAAAKVGSRYLVQTDYRWLPTANSNAAFGYNFEGGLQEYVLMDEKVITSPEGESMLIPASGELSASAVALVEPWACVEDSYAVKERTALKSNTRMLVAADVKVDIAAFNRYLAKYGNGGRIMWLAGEMPSVPEGMHLQKVTSLDALADGAFDDVVYFGADPAVAEKLFAKLATGGLINFVLCGGSFGRPVNTPVGRTHYGGIRIVGTTGTDPADSMSYIPASGELRRGDKVNVVGAAGPMGVMHVVRNICQGVPGVSVYAGDLDENRLKGLSKVAAPMAKKNSVTYQAYNPKAADAPSGFTYVVLMVPVVPLVAAAVKTAVKGAIINIFAGIPATVFGDIDLDAYIRNRLYFIGTSGSVLEDMKIVLAKAEQGMLDTNISVAAVCGLEAAVEGIRAVEKQLVPGKIIVYPACKGLPLIRLDEMKDKLPAVAAKLNDGLWTKAAEDALLAMA